MVDTVVREQTWIDLYAKPHLHDDFLCDLPPQGKQDDHIEALEYYKYLLPYLVPNERRYLYGHLWHPELHAGNVFVIPLGSTGKDGKIHYIVLRLARSMDWTGVFAPHFSHNVLRAEGRTGSSRCLARYVSFQ